MNAQNTNFALKIILKRVDILIFQGYNAILHIILEFITL